MTAWAIWWPRPVPLMLLLATTWVEAADPPALDLLEWELRSSPREQRLPDPARNGIGSGSGQGLVVVVGGVRFQAGRYRYQTLNLPGGGPFIDQVDFGASADERVQIDTRSATLPSINFLGLLTPAEVVGRRQPQAADQPDRLDFHLQLRDLNRFDGLISGSGLPHLSTDKKAENPPGQRWLPIRAAIGQATLVITTELSDGHLRNPRLRTIILDAAPGRSLEVEIWFEQFADSYTCQRAEISFSSDGRLENLLPSPDQVLHHRPRRADDPPVEYRPVPTTR